MTTYENRPSGKSNEPHRSDFVDGKMWMKLLLILWLFLPLCYEIACTQTYTFVELTAHEDVNVNKKSSPASEIDSGNRWNRIHMGFVTIWMLTFDNERYLTNVQMRRNSNELFMSSQQVIDSITECGEQDTHDTTRCLLSPFSHLVSVTVFSFDFSSILDDDFSSRRQHFVRSFFPKISF